MQSDTPPTMPKVSILTTVFNEEPFLSQMIASVANQDYSNIELIIVNDGSTDGTSQILTDAQRRHPWIRVINFTKNKGKCAAQNAAFAESQGDYIAIHGGDDLSHRTRISSQFAFIQHHSLPACITEMRTIDEAGHQLSAAYGTNLSPSRCPAILLKGSSFPAGTIMVTRALAQEIYPIPEELPYEDRWMTFKIQARTRAIGFIRKPLYDYRLHPGNSYMFKTSNSALQHVSAIRRMAARELQLDSAIYASLEPSVRNALSRQYHAQRMLHGRISGELSLRDAFQSGSLGVSDMKSRLRDFIVTLFPWAYLSLQAMRHLARNALRKNQDGRNIHATDLVVTTSNCADNRCKFCTTN